MSSDGLLTLFPWRTVVLLSLLVVPARLHQAGMLTTRENQRWIGSWRIPQALFNSRFGLLANIQNLKVSQPKAEIGELAFQLIE